MNPTEFNDYLLALHPQLKEFERAAPHEFYLMKKRVIGERDPQRPSMINVFAISKGERKFLGTVCTNAQVYYQVDLEEEGFRLSSYDFFEVDAKGQPMNGSKDKKYYLNKKFGPKKRPEKKVK